MCGLTALTSAASFEYASILFTIVPSRPMITLVGTALTW